MRIYSLLKYVLSRFPLHLVSITLMMVIVGLLEVTALISLAPVVDLILHPDLQGISKLSAKFVEIISKLGFPVSSWVLLAVFLGFTILKTILGVSFRYAVLWTNNKIFQTLLGELFEDIFSAKWSMFASDSQGKVLNTLVREAPLAGNAFWALGLFFSDVFLLLFCLAVPFLISWQVTLVGLATGAILAAPFILVGRVSYRLGQQTTDRANEMSSIIQESLSSAKVILCFGSQKQFVESFRLVAKSYCKAYMNSYGLRFSVPMLYNPCGIIAMIAALFAAEKVGLTLSETAVLLYALMRCVPYTSSLVERKHLLDNYSPSFEQVQAVKLRAQGMKQRSGTKEFRGFEREITLEEASFSYPGRSPVLVDVNVTIPKNTMIGIVGPSGSGKTSLVDIIVGFHELASGRVAIDDNCLADYDIISYRSKIGYVPQDSTLFNTTILNNLLWTRPNATEEDIREACRKAHATEFIESLPEGLDTVVGDRGIRLSGGQSQRLALARAILRRPDILILDEATSSLDTQSEKLIQQAIDSLARETTLVIIAHRLSTIANSDYIYVLDAGRVVEQGTYGELTNLDGLFASMARLQSLEPDNGRLSQETHAELKTSI
jgi:ABC-type multidrug transport system fused ATPase/permease subunit